MKKIIVGLFFILVLIIIIPLTALGIVPGLSSMIGAGPKDLGIRITPEDSKTAQKKAITEIIPITKDMNKKDYTLEGKINTEFEMNSKELTALSNNRPWKNYPVKNLQILIHDDGKIEASGVLTVAKAMPYAMSLGYSENQIRQAMQKFNLPPLELPFYITGFGSVANDEVTVNASQVKIGLIPIPGNIVAESNSHAKAVLEDLIRKKSASFHAESLTFTGGKMLFKGQVPEKEYILVK